MFVSTKLYRCALDTLILIGKLTYPKRNDIIWSKRATALSLKQTSIYLRVSCASVCLSSPVSIKLKRFMLLENKTKRIRKLYSVHCDHRQNVASPTTS